MPRRTTKGFAGRLAGRPKRKYRGTGMKYNKGPTSVPTKRGRRKNIPSIGSVVGGVEKGLSRGVKAVGTATKLAGDAKMLMDLMRLLA